MKKIYFTGIIALGACFGASQALAQNTCSNAQSLTIGADDSQCNSRTFSALGLDLDDNTPPITTLNGTCSGIGPTSNVSWYTFTGDGTTIRVKLFNQNNASGLMVLENQTCAATMTAKSCTTFVDDNAPHTIDINTINGANYKIIVFRTTGSSSMSGAICAYKTNGNPYSPSCDPTFTPPPPTMTVQPDPLACFTNYTKTVSGNTLPVPAGACGSGAHWLWGTFVATSNYTNFYYWGKEEDNMNVSLLEGPCSPSMVSLFCQGTGSEDFPTWAGANTVPGKQYYVIVRAGSSITDGRMCVYGSPTPEADKPFCQTDQSFEAGTGAGWSAKRGNYRTDAGWNTNTAATWNSADFELTTGGCDPTVSCALPKVAPGGGTKSFRIGTVATAEGNAGFAAAQSMEFCFNVTAANALFGYKYAVVMDYVAHLAWQQPEFQVFVEGSCPTGTVIPCGNFIHQPNDGVTPFNFVGDYNDVNSKSGGPIFSPWKDVAMDLSGFIGQSVKVVFRVKDCSGGGGTSGTCPIGQQFPGSCPPECTSTSSSGGVCTCNGCSGTACSVPADNCAAGTHWAYAYFDTYCIPMTITVPEFCAGASSIQICAPAGYQSYSWPAGQPGLSGSPTTQCVTVTNPVGGTEYTVNMNSITGCPTQVKVKIKNIPVTKTADTTVCAPVSGNIPLSITVTNATDPPYTYSWSHGLGSGQNKSVSPSSTTTYTVTITNGSGCSSTETITVNVQTCGPPAVTINGGATCLNGCVSLTATASGGTAPYTYAWSPAVGGTGAGPHNVCPTSTTTYTVTITDNAGVTATDTALVTIHPSTTLAPTKTDVTCAGANNGTATANPSGGTAPYTYAWTPSGGSANIANGLGPNTYTVTTTDSKGCTATATVVITEPTPLTATTVITNVSCNGGNDGTATVTAGGATPPYTYSWTPSGGNGTTATGLTAGTYTVLVTDNKGCTRTATAVITEPTALTANTTVTNISCNGGSDGSATVTAGGATAPYTYSWTPSGGNGTTATGLTAGTYTVLVTDNKGCTRTATAVITEPTPLVLNTSMIPAQCGQNDGSASVTASGATPVYTYSWSPGAGSTTTNYTGLAGGTYTVLVTDSRGCTQTTTITVTSSGSATVTANGTNVSCAGGNDGTATASGSGGLTPYTFSWNTAPTAQTGPNAAGLTAGTYVVTMTDNQGCISTASVTITEPPVIVLTTAKTDANCGGSDGAATVTASGGAGAPFTYSWSPTPGSSNILSGVPQGTYSVVVTDANGCTNDTTVSVGDIGSPSMTTSKVDVLCNGLSTGSICATVSGGVVPYTYTWAPSGGSAACANNLAAGSYTLSVTGNNGCTISTVVTITEPSALVINTSKTDANCGASDGSVCATVTGGTPGYTYSWDGGGAAACKNAVPSGGYTVTVTDLNGCTITGVATVNDIGAPAVTLSGTNVSCFGGADGTVSATAASGVMPYTYSWSPAPASGNVNSVSGLPAGTYVVTVTANNGCKATSSFTVTQPAAIALTTSKTDPTCVTGGTATVNATGGTPSYTYAWNTMPVQTTQVATGLGSQTYIVTVTDFNGCTQTTTVDLTNPSLPNASFTSVPGCLGTATQFTDGSTAGTGDVIAGWAWTFGDGNAATVKNPTNTYAAACKYLVTLRIVTQNGCVDSTSDSVEVYPVPVAALGSPAQGCAPVCAAFTDSSSIDACGSILKWTWDFGDPASGLQNISSTQNPTHCYKNAGSYNVKLTVESDKGCISSVTDSGIVNVYPVPVAQFIANPTVTEILSPKITFTDQSTGLPIIWRWSFGPGDKTDKLNDSSYVQNPVVMYKDTGTYTVCLEVETAFGCVNRTCSQVIIKPIWTFYIPNAFTPDGDGSNDYFIGKGYNVTEHQMWIYDRWGDLVYKTDKTSSVDSAIPWDGKANGGDNLAQQDVYVYVVILRDPFGKKHRYVGRVTLIR